MNHTSATTKRSDHILGSIALPGLKPQEALDTGNRGAGLPTIPTGARFPPWSPTSEPRWNDWEWQYANRVRSRAELEAILAPWKGLDDAYSRLIATYHYAITPYYLSLIDRNDISDPIRLQAVPDVREIEQDRAGDGDPLDERRHEKVPGLLHRYPDRVVAVITNTCAVYCRHCMRKRFWKRGERERPVREMERMIEYVSAARGVREVIVSGGDPLTLDTVKLDWFLGELKRVRHVEILRIGSRLPVVMPMRIDDELCTVLEKHRPLWLTTQFNHPREVTAEAARACEQLVRHGIPVCNQTVLLRGVNDSVDVMRTLCYSLVRISVKPYYLFHCDPVRGTAHFRTGIWTGIKIMEQLRRHCSGLSIPTYVVDTAGNEGKIHL